MEPGVIIAVLSVVSALGVAWLGYKQSTRTTAQTTAQTATDKLVEHLSSRVENLQDRVDELEKKLEERDRKIEERDGRIDGLLVDNRKLRDDNDQLRRGVS